MSRYAEATAVAPEASRAEIERTLRRYGADQFMYGWDAGHAVVAFRAQGRQIRFVVPLPDRKDFRYTPTKRLERSDEDIDRAWDQAGRQRWRALALAIKAKLEVVESGITTFEAEFLAYVVLPDGTTMGDWALPQVAEAYASGKMPTMLPALPSST